MPPGTPYVTPGAYNVPEEELAEFNAVPTETTAWTVWDYAPLRSGPPMRVSDQELPFADGVQSRRSVVDEWAFTLQMLVNGHHDPYGDPYQVGWPHGVDDNVDILKRELLRPRRDTLAGTRTFKWIRDKSGLWSDARVRQAPAKLIDDLDPVAAGDKLLVTLDFVIPGGVLRAPDSVLYDAQVPGTGEDTLQVFNDGTADEMAAVVTMSGPGRITNTDYDDAYLEWRGTGAVVLYCDPNITAAMQGADDRNAYVFRGDGDGLHWLPFAPGQNDLVITDYDGSAIPTVTVEVTPPFL